MWKSGVVDYGRSDRRGPTQRDVRGTGEFDAAGDPRTARGGRGHRERARGAIRPDASCGFQAHQGARAGGPGRAGSFGAIPAVRPGRGAAPRGVDLGGAVPARVGGPLRSDGRVPPTASDPDEGKDDVMSDQHGPENAVRIERSIDAPVALVWQLWTDPEHFKAWYGPEGATIPVATMDVRVGGKRLVC